MDEQLRVDSLKAKRKGVESALKSIKKQFGDLGAFWGDNLWKPVPSISSRSLSLDLAIGQGIPRGHITEISGPEGSGKTVVALTTIAECQSLGGLAAFIDIEQTLSPKFASFLGVRYDELLISKPNSADEAFEIIDTLIESGLVDIIVVDSVAGAITKMELEGEIGQAMYAPLARLLTPTLKRITPKISRTSTALVLINQVRENMELYGPSEVTPGGRALKHHSSVRLRVKIAGEPKIDPVLNKRVGHKMQVNVIKNKINEPFNQASFDLYYIENSFGKRGIDQKSELIDLAKTRNIIESGGAYTYWHRGQADQKRWSPATEFTKEVEENEVFAHQILEEIRSWKPLDEHKKRLLEEKTKIATETAQEEATEIHVDEKGQKLAQQDLEAEISSLSQ
jgi:recombination protein RecA